MRKFIFIVFFAVLSVLPLGAQIVNERMEQSMGDKMAQELERQIKTSYDPRVTSIGQSLVQYCGRPGLVYTFKVMEDKEVNALSIGGGYVYVYRGLLDMVGEDTDMLAFVIAHEVAHISQRHMARSIERSMVGGFLLGVALTIAKASEGTFNTVSVGWDVLQKGYSRTYEFEADRCAMQYVLQAGYDPEGGIRLFNELKKGENNPGIFIVLATHPPTEKRIEQLDLVYGKELEASQVFSQVDLTQRPPLFSQKKIEPAWGSGV